MTNNKTRVLSFVITLSSLFMKLIVGLGNPGEIYAATRHNIGFFVVKALSRVYKIPLKKDSDTFSLSGKVKIGGQNVILALPFTFMNLSGIAVKALLKKYTVDPVNLLVVLDDLDLEFGRQKIRPSGASGGHQGLNSIIEALGNSGFARLRIGIGRPRPNTDAAKYVLSSFTKKENGRLQEVIESAVNCSWVWVTGGISKSMNIFNQRSNKNA